MQRFWNKTKLMDNGCLEWTAGKSGGRGSFNYNGTIVRAYVFAWFLYYGVWPTKFVCHKCDNPACVKKEHLFEGSNWDNIQDATRKCRMGRKHTLTLAQRNAIREQIKEGKLTQRKIAALFGTTQATVRECKFFLHEPKL